MKRHAAMLVLLLVCLAIGLLTFDDYGESWDVNGLRHYADASLQVYARIVGLQDPRFVLSEPDWNRMGVYGPAFLNPSRLIEKWAQSGEEEFPSQIQHLVSFLAFLTGVVAFYSLCVRWMSRLVALGTTLLFASQPVLWGQAFVNPMDPPLMAFFLVAVALGLRFVDRVQPIRLGPRSIVAYISFWIVPFLLIFFGSGPFLVWLERLIGSAALGEHNIVSAIASDVTTVAPEVYVQKYTGIFLRVSVSYMLLAVPILFLITYRFLRPAYAALLSIAPAALALTLAGATRILGLFAGALIAAYALWRHGRRSLPHLTVYVLLGGMFLYLLWPYLWADPAGGVWRSLGVMSDYPWRLTVLFAGQEYTAGALPWSYLPVLLGIQLTEPVWILFAIGLAFSLRPYRLRREPLLLAVCWFLLPMAAFVLIRPPLYDNFRHLLFLLPPIFLMAGIAFQQIRSPRLAAAAMILCALPGILGVLSLHPYAYSYYNQFVGGVGGAFRRFEAEYWGTSYREAARYVSEIAPAGADVLATGPVHLFRRYARADLKVYPTDDGEVADTYDYVVSTTRWNLDLIEFPAAPVVHTVGRGGAVFAVIKQP